MKPIFDSKGTDDTPSALPYFIVFALLVTALTLGPLALLFYFTQ